MRPPAPVPLTRLRSILFSRAILRTSGESGPDASAAGSSAGCASGSTGGGGGASTGAALGAAATRAGASAAFSAGAFSTSSAGLAAGAPPSFAMGATTPAGRTPPHPPPPPPPGNRAGGGRRDFRIHLIGRNLEQRLVALHTVAALLEPLGQRAFDNALAHLGHHYVGHFSSLFPRLPGRAPRTASHTQKYGRNGRRRLAKRPPARRARPVAPWKSRAWSARKGQCIENSSNPYSRSARNRATSPIG